MPRLHPSSALRSAVLGALLCLSGAAGAEPLVEVRDYPPDELRVVGFEIPRAASVDIEAVGARQRGSDELVAYAWILNSTTRETIWSQQHGDAERVGGSRNLRRTRESLQMPAGRYELYTWAGTRMPVHWTSEDDFLGRHGIIITRGTSERDVRELERSLGDCFVTLNSTSVAAREVTRFEPTGEIPGALYRAAGLGNDACVRAVFTLDRPAELRVYCLGEIPIDADAFADGAWIVDTATRERVWELRRRDTRQAGGAEKNRLFDGGVHLAAGTYQVVAGTDGSHACKDWNAPPPDDPLNWGITLLPGKDFGITRFQLLPEWTRGEPLLALTRMRDDETADRAFRLRAPAEVQIYAEGEMAGGWDEFADRGWITKAGSGATVWEMTDGNTVAAGGATKNRLFDGTVKLAAGDYVAHFETDDSHAYDNWNADAPFDREGWGLAIYASPGMRRDDFVVVEPPREQPGGAQGTSGGAALASLLEVGDDADLRAEFSLDKQARVHIHAVGEGLEHEMYDYGWIENASTGQTVWEMTMRNTRHAGGARKNRLFDGDVLLDAGRYLVRFQTDGSHAYGDWNDRRPPDSHAWGIEVTRESQ